MSIIYVDWRVIFPNHSILNIQRKCVFVDVASLHFLRENGINLILSSLMMYLRSIKIRNNLKFLIACTVVTEKLNLVTSQRLIFPTARNLVI